MFVPKEPVKQLSVKTTRRLSRLKLTADWVYNRRESNEAKVSAWIEIDGNKVDIFGVIEDGSVNSGWVESTVGKEFVLCYELKMTNPTSDVCVYGVADGSTQVQLIVLPLVSFNDDPSDSISLQLP